MCPERFRRADDRKNPASVRHTKVTADRHGSGTQQPQLRIRGADRHVFWSPCDCSDKWWTTRFGGAHCSPRCTRAAPV
jgi:hypothetical protein